jgi:hypothetical protein
LREKIVPLQQIVHSSVTELNGYSKTELVRIQLAIALERLERLAEYAPDSLIPSLDELADVIAPLLVIAAELNEGDILATILAKNMTDMRDGKTKS